MKTKKKHYGSYLILVIFGLYMIFPLLSTFFYSTSTSGLIRYCQKILRFNGLYS